MNISDSKLVSYRNVIAKKTAIKPLHTLLPLPLPFAILVDPSNKCNFKCVFCPTGDKELLKSVKRPAGMMEFSLFQKIIVDISTMVQETGVKVSRLHLYKDGEPLVNKNFAKMVRLAVDKSVAESVETTTNAALLDKKMVSDILDAGLDVIRISVDGIDDASYKETTKTFSNYEAIRENVSMLMEERNRRNGHLKIFVKIVDVGFSSEGKNKFLKDFSPISDSINIDSLMGWSRNELKDWTLGKNSSKGMDGQTDIVERKVCPEPFAKLAVNFDGQASVCCVDWSYGTIVGDFRNENLKEIWHGEKLRQFRLTHLKGERENIDACKSCQYLHGLPEYTMLDAHADGLLSRYS